MWPGQEVWLRRMRTQGVATDWVCPGQEGVAAQSCPHRPCLPAAIRSSRGPGRPAPEPLPSCHCGMQRPKTAIHVWETRCVACVGTGTVRSRSRGRHAILSTCLICHGIGYVRHGSSDPAPPGLNDGGPHYTLGRPPPPPEKEPRGGPKR